MKAQKIILLGLLLVSLPLALPSIADDPGKAKMFPAIYLGNNQILDAAPPRQLSFRANVNQFDYQPGSDAIAFTGTQVSGDSITYFASLAGTKHGSITKMIADTVNLHQEEQRLGITEEDVSKMETTLGRSLTGSDLPRDQTPITLSGWSADGKYLLVNQVQYVTQPSTDENTPPQAINFASYTSIDLSTSPPTQRQIPLPMTLQPGMAGITSQQWWSPKKTLILFEQEPVPTEDAQPAATPPGDAQPQPEPQIVCTLYSPATQHVSSFTLPPKVLPLGWIDDAHVMLLSYAKPRHYLSYDTATGQSTEIPKPTSYPDSSDVGSPSKTSPTNPNLALEEQPVMITDSQKVATLGSQALWIRRAKGIKAGSALPVSLSTDPGPYEEWAPSGRQVAYLMHGDLFVTDLFVRPASAYDKLALGLDLTCDEQKQVATSRLKQVGLGLLQYMQDYDNHFPPAGDVKDRVMPYVKSDDMFSLGSSQFVYYGSGQTDASIANPADFVLGTLDTPCAHIVVYADGHVKAFDRQNTKSGAALGPCSDVPLSKIKHSVRLASASRGK